MPFVGRASLPCLAQVFHIVVLSDGRMDRRSDYWHDRARAMRRWVVVAAVVAVCGLEATPAVGYVLEHPKHENCRMHYARTQRTIKEHGRKVKQTICVWAIIPKPKPTPSPPAKSSAWCEASAEYSSEYENWEIFVHSNQPYRSAEARASNGDHFSYETNSEGYADIYLYVHGNPGGQQVTVEVGEATCSTTLD
jgi:hypothetical protein